MAHPCFDTALAEKGPEIRKRLEGWEDDGRHVFVATWARADGSGDVIVWRTLEGLVGCIARHEFFNPQGPPMGAHWVIVRDEP